MLESTTLEALDREFQRLYDKFGAEKLNDLTTKVAVGPDPLQKGLELNYFRFRGNSTKEDKLLLGIFLWYCPPEIRVLGQFELERTWPETDEAWLAALTASKELALGTLLVQTKFNDNDFWGNIITEKHVKTLFNRFPKRLWKRRKQAQTKVRRRGHRDSAGGSSSFFGKPNKIDFSKIISEEEYLREQELKEQEISQFLATVLVRLYLEHARGTGIS